MRQYLEWAMFDPKGDVRDRPLRALTTRNSATRPHRKNGNVHLPKVQVRPAWMVPEHKHERTKECPLSIRIVSADNARVVQSPLKR